MSNFAINVRVSYRIHSLKQKNKALIKCVICFIEFMLIECITDESFFISAL